MKVAIGLGPAGDDWAGAETWVTEAERLGVDSVWTGESWGRDAISPLAYFAGKTSRIKLGCGIMQTGTRSPGLVAMEALSMASMSDDRFILGLGTSGPQVIEGWHGVSFDRAMTRMRETVEIVRRAMSGERVVYEGEIYRLPLPGGEGRALRTSATPRDVPIYLATLGPKSLEMTGAIADGWLASSFMPRHASVFLDRIRAGAETAGREMSAIDLQAGGVVEFGDGLDEMVERRKPGFAFEIGAMGSRQSNFYKDAYSRQGYGELVETVQSLWLDRRRDEAAALIPDEFVLDSNLLGTDEMVRSSVRGYRDAGITSLRVAPAGDSVADRLDTLGRLMDIVNEVERETHG